MIIYTADNTKTLTDKIVEDITKKSADNLLENYVVIVPEKFSVTIEKQLLTQSKRKALLNVQVVTLSRLLHKLVSVENNYISKETGVMLVKKILIDNIDNLVCYKKTARTMGFAQNIYDTISELKNSKVTPMDYAPKKGSFTTSLDLKLRDIFSVYSEYEKILKDGKMVDACDRFDLLASLIYKSEYIATSHIYVLGYDSVTPAGLNVFEAIARNSKSICFSCLDNEGKNNSYVCPSEMKENFLKIAKNLNKKPSVIYINTTTNEVSKHIANNMYAYPYSKMQVKDQVLIYEAENPTEEITMVAESIRRRVVYDGLRYNDIAVACSNLEGYSAIIKKVFGDYDLPFFIDSSERLMEHPFITYILNVINVCRKNFAVDEYMMVASSDFSGLNREEVGLLDNFIVKYGVGHDRLKSPFKMNVYSETEKNFILYAEKIRLKLSNKLMAIQKMFSAANTAEELVLVLRQIFEQFNAEEMLDKFRQKLIEHKDFVIADVTSQVMDKVTAMLTSISQVFGSSKMDLDEFYMLLQAGFSGQTVSIIPISIDNVFVGDVSTSKFFNKKDLYVIGANEGRVPKVKDDCGIIVDKELGVLSSGLGKKIEPTIKTINMREKAKIIGVMQEFSERLVVSYPKLGFQSEEENPSSIVRELSKMFYHEGSLKPLEKINMDGLKRCKGLLSEKDRQLLYASEFATLNVSIQKLTTMARDIANGKSIDNKQAFDSLFASICEIQKKSPEKLGKELLYSSREEDKLKDPKSIFFKSNRTGVTQLETYFSCPFKHFANYGLKLRAREVAELRSNDYGNVLHKVAELYMKNIERFEKKSYRDMVEKQLDIEKLINKVFDEEKLRSATNKHMVLLLFAEAKRLIDALTYQYRYSGFKPVAEELVFGSGSNVLGIPLSRGVSLEGKIDRIDRYGNYFRIVDYKTGHIDLSPKKAYYGTKLQLFSYLNATNKAFKTLEPAGAFYLPIRNVFVEDKIVVPYSTYKMQGYFNKKEEIIKAMDPNLSPNKTNKSDIANITISQSKDAKEMEKLVATGTNALSYDEICGASQYQQRIMKSAVDEILSGYIAPSPIEEDGRVPCEYCEYKYSCGRDFNSNKGIRKTISGVKFENFVRRENCDG